MSLDDTTKMPELEKGLFALNGIATIDDTNSMRFDENRNIIAFNPPKDYVDMYLFIYNKDFALCMKDYYELTGYPKMIPRYALGNWWSKEYEFKDSDILAKIDRFKMRGIPLSVFLLDTGWSKKDSKYPGVNDGFSFNQELYPNPMEFVKKVHERDVKLGVKINPQYGFYPFETNFQYISQYLPINQKGYVDFSPANLKAVV